jgi:hypothetical protein
MRQLIEGQAAVERAGAAHSRRSGTRPIRLLARAASGAIEPRLKPGGKYEMAMLELREGMAIDDATVRRLAKEAVALNKKLGDPTDAAK